MYIHFNTNTLFLVDSLKDCLNDWYLNSEYLTGLGLNASDIKAFIDELNSLGVFIDARLTSIACLRSVASWWYSRCVNRGNK